MFFLFFSFPAKTSGANQELCLYTCTTLRSKGLSLKSLANLFVASAQNKIVYSSKSPPDGIFCLSFAIWVLATSYTWTNLSRLCQFKIWLVPKRYKKTAGTDVTRCLTGTRREPRYLGYLWARQWEDTLVIQQPVILAKVLISRLPHIWFYVYHVICNCL
jgi:hypothetical protein